MKTKEQILNSIRARDAGRKAARDGKTLAANPYPEENDLHWDWLNAWVSEFSERREKP